MAHIIRRIISKNRRRYTEDGFDLDLCYVTDRIIAMGYPAEGGQGFFRNSRSDVLRLLEMKHSEHYRVYNLCDEKQYDPQSLGGEVALFPFGDHQTPPLRLVVEFCENAEQWLLANPRNVVVVHCKAGKGRTGIMICALLMYMGICDGPEEALRLFAITRTLDGVGVSIPSQRRYVFYFYYLLLSGNTVPSPTLLQLQQIRLSGFHKFVLPRLMVRIWVRDNNTQETILLSEVKSVASTKHSAQFVRCTSPSGRSFMGHLPRAENYHLLINSQELYIIFENDPGSANKWRVGGDIKIQVFEETLSKRSSLFFSWLNTSYIEQSPTILRRHELDKANRCLSSEVQMEVFFSGVQPQRIPSRGSSFSGRSSRRRPSLLQGRSQSSSHPGDYALRDRRSVESESSPMLQPAVILPATLKDAEASWNNLNKTWDKIWMQPIL